MISAFTNEMSATFARQRSNDANSITASAQATNDLMSGLGCWLNRSMQHRADDDALAFEL
jgi:hypothetical protein